MEHEGLLVGGTIVFTILIIVFSLAVTIIPLVLVFRWLAKTRASNQQLLVTGVPAQARIVAMGPTGLTVNDAPQMNLSVEIHPPQMPGYRGHAAPFMATVQAFLPVYAMGRIQPGATVPVRFDPMNPQRVAIDLRSMGFM